MRLTDSTVDIVVLTWNDGDLLQHAVDSVNLERDLSNARDRRRQRSDQPPSLAPAPNVELVRNDRNRGVAAARNQGAALGTAPFILLLDSDAELSRGVSPHSSTCSKPTRR